MGDGCDETFLQRQSGGEAELGNGERNFTFIRQHSVEGEAVKRKGVEERLFHAKHF